ncbi:unnamed protein product [Pieris macdunnoughi]|uniref:HYDIN/VesB/CFA65-like Ig-like domain-containing protein n=1 Tax=Pieris macdunnoughi TaxID=345717 RepID=A0A821LVA0_9NEOP|nr:unnamed protein product [Pieris macdunnoughi]
MELLQKFKQNGYFTADLYHLIAQKKSMGHSEEFQIIPSDYIRELKMSTLERLQSLHAIQIDNYVISGSKSNKTVLSFSPKVIVFQNFKPNDKIVAKFSVKNISKAPTFLNMVFKESSYFFIKPCGNQLLSRLAPGISATFAITFQPAQYEDYTHRVTFYTDVDQYIVPLIAMGPRPIFDFPDSVVIPKTPLKVEKDILVSLRNVGTVPGGFTLSTRCPFSVQPKSAYLNPSQKVDVRIALKTMRLGDINSTLNVIFESGENFKINLSGHTYTVSVELEKQVVRFFDTYNTLVRQQTFKITNKSDHILSYMCLKNECIYYDFEEKVKLASVFYNLKDLESGKCEKLVYYDVLSSDEHERVYTRIFYDEIQALVADESLQYQDKHFSITPIYGKLWPKKSTEITIAFSPKDIGEFSTIAYLDIDGVNDRVPLKIVGTSLPPSINLNLETLDMDCVYINKKYDYEIVSINKGHINGVIVYKNVPPLFGSKITCTPSMHCLRPGEKDIFVISFCNSNQGPFFEEINFAIRDTDVVLKVYLKGVVIYPSLMFSIPCLDFGMVSLGVPKTMELEVINESIVDVNANVKISSDGPEISSITLEDYAVTNKPKPTVPQWPREFHIAPHKVNIGPESRVSLKITLTANLIRANQTSLELELDKSDSPPITLPVTFNAMVPAITPASDINLRACFLDFPYKCDIVITSNEFWGYFTLEEPEESSTLEVKVGVKEGLITPNCALCLPVIIKTNVLGMQEQSICVNLFGMSSPVQICRINGCGVRPIVTCTPIALHWGQVKLLTRTQKTLTLCNDSPVVVNYRASLLNRDGRWQIYPTEGFIEPEGETDLTLSLYLIDADSYTNKAVIQLERVKDILVPLSAIGVGTSILVGEFRDRVVLGRHFTKIPLNCQVVMENCGTRMHALEWSEYYKAPKTKQHSVAFYNLEPKSFKVAAGEKLELTITGLSHKVTTVKEMWYLVGSVEGINKKELLLECQIIAEFVDPKIEISSNVLDFQYDYGPYSEFYKLTDIVTIRNVSKLPLDFDISVKPPFAIIHKQTTYKVLPDEENLCGCICYTESDLNVLKMTDSDPYQCKIFIDYLTLKPVDPLRNEPLHFFQDINKIKLAFNLTHTVEERLEDQEVMKIQVLFDTTKHLSLKSRVYCDLLRVKFKGHKNKDVIKLIGKINFPNVLILTPRIDFQCVLNGSIESKTIKIQNVTPLLVCYQFNWKKYCILGTKLPDRSADTVYKSSTETEASTGRSGGELHEILACRTPVGSAVDNIGKEIIEKSFISTTQNEVPLETISVLNEDITQDIKFKKYVTMKTITPMVDVDYESDFEWIHKFSKKDKSPNICINDVLQLTPHRGLLKPNEVEFIHVIFRPNVNMNIRATLECEVLGGPAESILVTGQSSDLIYKLNTGKINFKIRSFHENAFEQLILTNVSQLPFEYKTYLNEPKWENDLYGTILNVIPDGKVLEPEEFISVNIEVRPGAMGYFGSTFVLEVGHLPFIPIEVFGWGVIPQVYISLPRPEIAKLSPEVGYQAIPTLTEEYLEAINEIFMNRVTEHLNSPFTEKCFEDPMFQKDWFICSTWDGYPSSMDIELAIERMLLINYIKLRPDILNVYSTTSKMIPIPGFQTTPYVIDYGVVITGSCVHCCVDIINYGPIVIKLHFAKGTQVPIWLGLKLCGKLNPGESGKLEATFSPTSNDFTELEQNVETSFNIDVPYGVTIPIQIKALCAVPYLMSNVRAIDFGTVRCGDKVISSIPLKNIGKPTCIWYVTLKSKTPGPNPMTVLDSSGKFEPGEGGWLSIAFKPIMELPYEGLLVFKFHMNPNRMTIPVSGQGIVPQVHIIGPNVSFPPTLPWAETTDIYFGLTNPCPFPIELIVAHSDVNWNEEEEIYQLLNKYYNKPDEMLVKAIRPGAGMPEAIMNFYIRFKERVKRCIEEEGQMSKITTKQTAAAKKSKNIKGPVSKTTTRDNLSPKKARTEAEIINDIIGSLKESKVDPLKECIAAYEATSTADDQADNHAKGILIFFHGSPCEEINCQEMAYSTGKALGIPTVNVDMCVVEALCTSTCNAKQVILNAVNEMFDVIHKFKGDDEKETESEDLFKETDDEFDIIWKKIEFLANSKNIATPRSKASDKKKKRSSTSSITSHSAVGAMGSTTMFQMDLTTELLTDFFKHPKFNRGFIVDTLTSIVFKSPPLTLTSVIKCKSNIWNIHLVLCQSDFTKWAQSHEETQREHEQVDENASKIYDETEIENIIDSFEDMDENEFENANPEHKSIYITYGLEDRRRQYYEKQGHPGDYVKLEKSGRDRSKSLLVIDNESKKKMKKEDTKAKPTSEYLLMSTKYNEYSKNTFENLVNIANNWIIEEGEVGFPLYGFSGQIVGSSHKKLKKKSEIQLQTSEVSICERGFPLTLIYCPCLRYKTAIVNMFLGSELVRDALREDKEYDILNCPINLKEFTVLLPKTFPLMNHEDPLRWQYLDESPIKKCECNPLTDLNLLDDTSQDNVLNILSKWHCSCGKKVTSSQTSTSEIPSMSIDKTSEDNQEEMYPLPLHSVKCTLERDSRIVLEPGDLVRCKYSFSPQYEGNYAVKRFVEVSGWPASRIDINVSAICDLPRLDSRPKKMFENFVRRSVEDKVYKVTYIDDQKLFEFGPIFIGVNRIYEEQYSIELRNSSLITADVIVEFLEETSVFQIDKTFVNLEPGCREKVTVSAAPADLGIHTSVLLFCVKDNPEIVTVKIACNGVVPVVEILPLTKSIEYGRHLLYRKEDDRFIVKNDSILPIMWQIHNPQDFVEDFIIAQTSGIVQRQDNQVVPVTYIACRVGVISHRALTVDIYDAEGRGNPMIVDALHLSAECYDVMVECAYENPSENFLNYGNVKVNSTVVQEMLKKVKNFPEPSLLKSFEAIPECGVVPPTVKLINIEFECTPTTSMNLVNVPAYICSLLDGSKNQVVVAKFPVCVTIASFYNTFTLFPLGELNFHIIPVGSGVMREVILNNTSKCPITYEIILPEQYQLDPDAQPAAKLKDNKIKNPPLKCGNFFIMNDDNLLAPGTSRTLQIQFMATAARTFEETIKFIISDTCPAEACGVPLRLVGTGAMPTLDFWNIETTFREHLIVKYLSDYKVPESSPHCVFVEDSVTLHFYGVNVNTSYTASIDLYNSGLVASALTMRLHYQSNSSLDIFSLDKYQTHIEPLLHKNLGIIFSPKRIEQYRAVLEIKLKLLDNQEKSFKVCLIGDGVIPRIRLLYPQLRHHRIALLQFPVTCLGSITKQQIRFKNISSVKSKVKADVFCPHKEERPIFWITSNFSNFDMDYDAKDMMASSLTLTLCPKEVCTIHIHFNPIRKGRVSCDVKLTIFENPYEFFVVLCEAEAFMEDVIIVGLEMLSMELDLDAFKSGEGTVSTASTSDTRKKSKSAAVPKKSKIEIKKSKRISQASVKHSDTTSSIEHSLQKYLLDFEGCELFAIKKRTVIMVNNSEKLYRFSWEESELVVVKPSIGYISPGEEKDLEIIFFSPKPIVLKKEFLYVTLMGVIDDSLTMDIKGSTWDNRQTVTAFDHNEFVGINERYQAVIDEQFHISPENALDIIQMVVVYSATAEYTKYSCDLKEELNMNDTFIYQTRTVNFKVRNTSKVPMKILWNFVIDDEFPSRIDKEKTELKPNKDDEKDIIEASQITLFSEKSSRESVDTWFEVDLPFAIEPPKQCLKPNQNCTFKLTFAPLDAFSYKVRLKSFIENMDPYDQNISCKISAKSLVPYVHLDIEESDYLTSGKRKGAIALPPHVTVLEFNVLGSGCYKKDFNVINPTNEGYEFIFEMLISEKPELVPVHCNKLKGFVDGGTSTEVEFTFAPTAPGIYESQWKFLIPVHSIVMNLLVVGIVREPDVLFVPTILLIRNSLVGFTSENVVILKNNENESLNYEFKGNSLCNESGKTPVVVEPEMGVLRARSATEIRIIYTPIQDGPLSFKIFCNIQYLTTVLTLCVNALSHSIKPKILYYLIGNEHVLNSDAITNIHLDQTASTYQRTIPFTIKNDGSATFFFEWQYTCSAVKKYLQVSVEPNSGHVKPGGEVDCTVYFTLKQVPVQAFPMTLSISDGPEYSILLHAEISKPTYHFSCMDFDFGKCIVNAPDATYKKNIAFENEDSSPIILDLNFSNIPELFVYYQEETHIEPGRRMKISIFFRPKQVKLYEFKLHFWVNSLCEEIVTIKGEGVPLLYDLYEGCQKSFDLGAVKVGDKIVRQIEVMNHSKVSIDATFIFKDIYGVTDDDTKSEGTSVCLSPSTVLPPNAEGELSRGKMLQQFKDEKIREQISMDVQNALSSLKVIPNKCTIRSHRKVPIKIQFKPIGMISNLNVQLNMKVFHFERPLVRLSGCATGMSLSFSQNSLQFGRVRKRGCKILKVMLQNKGDFGARFWWQPLKSDEFQISPSQGTIAARTNVTFTITFRPVKHNPFIKVWASCNIENYPPLELALYATCVDIGNIQNKSLYLECPVREVQTEYIIVTNPSDDMWLVLSEISGGPFETLKEFQVEPNSTFEIPVYFKPKSIGKHESQVLYSPLGESALFVTLIGAAMHPNPNGTINISVSAKEFHTEELFVYNITEFPEEYVVSSEIVKIIPDKFEGHYEIKHPDTVKVWGEAAATCRWTIVCFEECEIQVKVIFVNVKTREYQFYNIIVTINPSKIVDTLTFVSRARESAQMEISVKNPLSTDAEFQIRSDKINCTDKLIVPKNSSTVLLMTYSPLVVGESEDFLEVSNNLVGSYIYGVVLKCLPAKEKCLEFSTPLGTSIPLRLRVQNKTDAKTEFVATVSHPSILLEREYTLSAFEKGKFKAIFEPTEMGVQHCKVSFNSAVAGEFVFKIKGTATTPKPQGPFEIKAGGFAMISFKNVFQDHRMFKINVDREDFYVKTLYEPIKSKKDIKFPVYLNEHIVSGEYPTGCLTIETYEPADPKVQWTFFLQGVP